MVVRNYMTSNVFTVRIDKKLLVARDIMEWAHIRHVPVVDSAQHLVGIISHRDLLHAAMSSIADAADVERTLHLGKIPIDRVMKTEVITIGPDASIQEAAALMRTKKIGCLPVVQGEKLVGIISEYDLLEIVESSTADQR